VEPRCPQLSSHSAVCIGGRGVDCDQSLIGKGNGARNRPLLLRALEAAQPWNTHIDPPQIVCDPAHCALTCDSAIGMPSNAVRDHGKAESALRIPSIFIVSPNQAAVAQATHIERPHGIIPRVLRAGI